LKQIYKFQRKILKHKPLKYLLRYFSTVAKKWVGISLNTEKGNTIVSALTYCILAFLAAVFNFYRSGRLEIIHLDKGSSGQLA
jgi:hypothetical protein